MRRVSAAFLLWLATASTAVAATASTAAGVAAPVQDVQLTQVGRLPFPERGYVVDLPEQTAVAPGAVEVRENGRRIQHVDVSPLRTAGIHVGFVLAIDASNSMAGAPIDAAVAAAGTFVARRQPDERVGLVTFNGTVHTLQPPTSSTARLQQRLAGHPQLAYGTHIYDALARSLRLLAAAKVSTGSVVLLSDGADVGSRATLAREIAAARSQHVRVFTVGLRSRSFDPAPLRTLASATGGTYAEAATTRDLTPIYDALRKRLASEYLVEYRSTVAPRLHVDVIVAVAGVGAASASYTAPTPSGLKPFHRSPLTSFILSPGAVVLLALLVAVLVAVVVRSFMRPRASTVVERLDAFADTGRRAGPDVGAPLARVLSASSRASKGWLGRLARDLEIARMDVSAERVAAFTVAATVLMVVLLGLISPIFAVLGLLTALIPRAVVQRRLKQVRDAFADQLAPNLQVLASAMRVGHSFNGALAVVVENAHEPSRSELRRALADEQLGVPIEEALRQVATRMANSDLEQVALLAELQRTTGGNAAAVLDTVVGTLRERADLRRLMKTLTAQGRMGRWILTGLPILTGAVMWFIAGAMMRPLFTTRIGQVLVVVAVALLAAGSLLMQKLVEVEV